MPDDQSEIEDLDFAGEMSHLAQEAQLKAPPPAPRFDRRELMLGLGQMVRPLAIELENIKRATVDNGVLLAILGKAAKAPPAPQGPQVSPAESDALERIGQQIQRLGQVETANQKLFDALHAELKGYKDNFLFDALQRPFIRDLVAIFDDFSAVHVQISERLASVEPAQNSGPAHARNSRGKDPAAEVPAAAQTEAEFLRSLAGNVDNQVHHLLELFLRLEVVLSQSPPGTALDKKMHRTVAFEQAERADDDAQVVRSLKPGFTWRERMIRPEEVVVYRWTGEPPPAPAVPEEKNTSDHQPAPQPENRRSGGAGKSAHPDEVRTTIRIPTRDAHRRKPPTEALL
jgi:molecular chaperone GrpE (heat shock protein)